jgi:hypothetical protein
MLISTAAVGVMIPNLLFWADLGGTLIDVELLGITEFIFIEWIPLSLRVTTLFHLWLPVLHLYLLKKTRVSREGVADLDRHSLDFMFDFLLFSSVS